MTTYPAIEPLTYRWRPKGAELWIYDPAPQWVEDHQHDRDCEIEPVYSCEQVGNLRSQLIQARGALAWIFNNTEPDAIKHRDYDNLAAALCEIAKRALDGEFVDDMRAAEVYDLNKLSDTDENSNPVF